ncbi:MAG: NAD(P)-dependent oxidoreductase [Pirellulaceae bacterium]
MTGSAGFAGSHLTRHLLAAGDSVLGVTLSAEWPPCLGDLAKSGVPLVAWDLSQDLGESARRVIEDFAPEAIYHLAAISLPAACGADSPTPASLAVNVEGSVRVAKLALELPTRPKLLFVSSSKVYGPRDESTYLVDENAPLHPAGGYGLTKHLAEERLLALAEQGLPLVIARAFNHTGPGQEPVYLVPQWCQKQHQAESPVHVRSLNTTLDLSDVRDVVQIYRRLMNTEQASGIVNVGSGHPTTTAEIWRGLCEISGYQGEVLAETDEVSHQPIADLSRLQSWIGPVERIPLAQTLKDTWDGVISAGGRVGEAR